MDGCCTNIPANALEFAHDSTNGKIDLLDQHDCFEKLNKNFVDLFTQHIITDCSVECLQQCLEKHQFTKETINQNLNLCSVVFFDDNDESVTYSEKVEAHQNQMSPFLFAVFKGRIQIVRFLLDNYELDLEVECTLVLDEVPVRGISALWMAVSLNSRLKNLELVLLLLNYGADINHGTKSRSTPLRVACFDNNVALVQLLIQQGADVNMPNKFQNTCLMLASFLGFEQVCRLLIDANADPDRQALCGATALHFASQQGHGAIVKMLLYHGAKFLANNNGFTPLFVAAENTQVAVVQQIFSIPNLTTFEERITACELLGASYATTSDRLGDYNFILEAYTWFKNAFKLRFSANLASDHSDLNDFTLPSENYSSRLPDIPKPENLEPLSAYANHRECKTMAELESIKMNSTKMLYECFVILERILGPKNLTLAEALVIRGAEFADIGQFAQSCQLWLRAIQIKINAKVFIGEDCLRFIRVLERMILERTSYCEYLEQLLQLGIEYYTLRPRLFGYRKLCYRINVGSLEQFEDFTFNDLKRDLSPVLKYNTNLDLWNKVDSDLDSDQVMLSQLYLCSIVAKHIHEYNTETVTRFRKLVHRLCKLNITQNITGRTLLHLAMSTEPDEEFHFNNRFNNVLIRYPSVITAQFLILCGADVTATDIAFNTPLHYLFAFCITDSEARSEQQFELYNLIVKTKMSSLGQAMNITSTKLFSPTLSALDSPQPTATPAVPAVASISSRCPLFYGGEFSVHMDSVNIFGQTPMQSSTSIMSDILFGNNTKQVYSLKCFAARAVHQRHLFCDSCRTKAGKFELEKLWSQNPYPDQRYIKLLRYNQILSNNIKVPKAKHRFSYLDKYCSHNIVDYHQHHNWHVMNYFAQKLSISLELIQFVEMHGPCKFLHFPCVSDLPNPIHCEKC